MREVLNGQPELDFSEPPGIVTREICAMSGLLATPAVSAPPRRTVHRRHAADPARQHLPDLHHRPRDRARSPTTRRRRSAASSASSPCCRRKRATGGCATASRCRRAARRCSVTDSTTGLRLLAPDPYTIFQISPILPADTQRLRLTVGAPPGTQAITYLLDGQPLGTVDAVALGAVVAAAIGRSRTGGAGAAGGRHDRDERRRPLQRDDLRAAGVAHRRWLR